MLTVWLGDGEIPKNVKKDNDAYFVHHFYNDPIIMTKKHADLISTIDGVVYDFDRRKFIPKYTEESYTDVKYLSTGCKTALNVLTFPDIYFYAGCAGENALTEIFKLQTGHIYIDYFFLLDDTIPNVNVLVNGVSKVVDNDEFYKILNTIY